MPTACSTPPSPPSARRWARSIDSGRPSMGAEDFAEFAERVPAFQLRIGSGAPGPARPPAQRPLPAGRALHRPRRAGAQPDRAGYAGVTHRIAELTAPEVAARLAAGACAILPMGSLETHGPQAPMGDFLLAEAIADRIAAAASGGCAGAAGNPLRRRGLLRLHPRRRRPDAGAAAGRRRGGLRQPAAHRLPPHPHRQRPCRLHRPGRCRRRACCAAGTTC